MTGYSEGDEVTVYRAGRPAPGVIEQIGRSLVYIRSRGRVEAFRISDQRSTGRQVGSGTYFTTPAQVSAELDDREFKARTVLYDHGVTLDIGRDFTLEQIEALAEVVRNWED